MKESHGKLVWLSYENIDVLEQLKDKLGLKSPNQVLPILFDLEKSTNGNYQLGEEYKCNACGKSMPNQNNNSNIPKTYKIKNIIRHSDLEMTECRGTCRKVIGAKTKNEQKAEQEVEQKAEQEVEQKAEQEVEQKAEQKEAKETKDEQSEKYYDKFLGNIYNERKVKVPYSD